MNTQTTGFTSGGAMQPSSERSVGELMKRLSNDSVLLVKQEAQLFRAETEQRLNKARRDMMVLGAGVAIAHVGLFALVAAAILLVGKFVAPWIAALVIGVALVGAGGLAVTLGKIMLKEVDLVPRKTVRSVQRDVQMLKEAL